MDGLKTKQRVSDETLNSICDFAAKEAVKGDASTLQLIALDYRDARAERDTAVARVAELEALLGQARDALEPFETCSMLFGEAEYLIAFSGTDVSIGDLRTAARVHAALSEELKRPADKDAT